MIYTLNFHSEALIEYTNAGVWYELQKEGLGEKFLTAVDEHIADILSNPYVYSTKKAQYWEAKVRKFPFIIVYKIFPRKKLVFISAIHHTSRNPRNKYKKPEL